MGLVKATQAASKLSLEELRLLDSWLHGQIQALEEELEQPLPPSGREVAEERKIGHRTYRLEYVRCGKEGCHCQGSSGHGPYWYAYWSERGKTRSAYVGKKLRNLDQDKQQEQEGQQDGELASQ